MKKTLILSLAVAGMLGGAVRGYAHACSSAGTKWFYLSPASSSTAASPLKTGDSEVVIAAATGATLNLGTSNSAQRCRSYYSGGSWVTDANYLATGLNVKPQPFSLLNTSNNAPSRFQFGFVAVPSGATIPASNTAFNTVDTVYPSTDTNNYKPCTDNAGTYYWKLVACNI